MSNSPFQPTPSAFLSDDDPRGRSRILNSSAVLGSASQSAFQAARNALAAKALEQDGVELMLSPKREAALHEAGHAVFCAATGIETNSVSIFRLNDEKHRAVAAALGVKEGLWSGATYAPGRWSSTPYTSVDEDLLCAQNSLAGFCGEWAHDLGAIRQGSSLDEIVLAQMACGNAARKTGEAQEVLFVEQIAVVVGVLRANRTAHEALAARLMRKSTIGPDALKRLLKNVHTPIAPATM